MSQEGDGPLPASRSAPAPTIVRHRIATSTQTLAFELAETGAPDRTVIVAETQTAGRGRRGRRWYDAPGDSLLASIVARPRLAVSDLPKLSLTTAVAVAEALQVVAALEARLKWPNDVLVGRRKIAGILLESRIGATPLVVVGIGINLRQRSFPVPLAAAATSVMIETGRPIAPDTMLEALLSAFDAWRARLEDEGFGPVRAQWLKIADTIGRVIEVDGRSGMAIDLDVNGALLIRDRDGVERVMAGELTSHTGRRGN